jgi:putative MFS transporter
METEGTGQTQPARALTLAVVVAALGYLVDIYDLILFSVVRLPSLAALGVAEDARASVGLVLLNAQMIGMLVGGVIWGVLGDKRGRLTVLFGSITMYSLANIANGFVDHAPVGHAIETYAVLRFVAGIGLAGELGAGITLVSELVGKEARGYATTIVAGIGVFGALIAFGVSRVASWQAAYWFGGAMGLALLALRVGVLESGIFHRVRSDESVSRGNFFALFATPARARKYVSVILVGVPVWFAIGIPITLADAFGRAMSMQPVPSPAVAVVCAYSGLAVGSFGSGILSQLLQSRRRALAASLVLNLVAIGVYFLIGPSSLIAFYGACVLLGIANGYWAVFVTVAAEQFGTNVRATATTTAPNFVRGSLVAVSAAYTGLQAAGLGVVPAGTLTGIVVGVVALLAVLGIEETYGKDLDFVEK